ncbi:ABC transporter permease [Paenibacillus antibioticophila]|uniref:ABC transporter permease n=1 Tax=Paenibacillus antibioticophila TaxID=1274374 RepID=UPI0005C805CB|nr:ABC transporter permease [Paenibacillus antibioticophila]
MSIWESILVALDNLRMNKLRSFLTMIGIVFGVAAVVTVVSIGQAGQSSIISNLSNYKDGYFVLYPNVTTMSEQEDLSFRLREFNEIRKQPGIRYVTSSNNYMMKTKLKKESLQFMVTGTTSETTKMQNIDLVAGRFFSQQEERGRQKVVVVDAKYAEKAYGSANAAIGRKLQLNTDTFRIIGVFKIEEGMLSGMGGEQYSSYAPITALSSVDSSAENARFGSLEIVVTSPDRIDDTVASLKKWLADKKNVSPDVFLSQTAKEAEQMVSSTFSILQTIIGAIAGISLLVGGIGVMNIMLVSVTERTREIGIRKAIGATPGTIMLQFMIEAIILSFIGGTVGALFGLLFAYIFALISGWPFVVSVWAILLAFGFSAAVGIFFGLYPANKASKLHPIESLRYE